MTNYSKKPFMKSLLVAATSLLCLSAAAEMGPVESGSYKWDDIPVTRSSDRDSRIILEGTTAHLEYFRIHATTQYVGAKPNPPSSNADVAEVIIVREGLMKMTIDGETDVLPASSVTILPPGTIHTIENVGNVPLSYYVLKYRSRKPVDIERGEAAGGARMYNVTSLPLIPSELGSSRPFFDRATSMTDRYEMHITHLYRKVPSHAPHEHEETEIILVLSGETAMEIEGEEYTARAGDLYYIKSQLNHGVRNTSDTKAAAYYSFKWK